jgi:hypothetical protein
VTPAPALPSVDVHDHVIAPDAVAYPPDPMSGHQSAWSKERASTHQDLKT